MSHILGWLLSKRQVKSNGEDVEKRQLLHTVGENVKQHSHYRKQYGHFSKIKLSYDSTTSCLAIYPKELKSVS